MTDRDLLVSADALAVAAHPEGGGPLARALDGPDADAVRDELRAAVAHAQEAVGGALGYHPMVRAVVQAVLFPRGGPYVTVHTLGGPVAQVFTVGVTTDGRVLYPTPAAVPYPPPQIAYAVGWRGEHHTLDGAADADGNPTEALAEIPGLETLTVLPALVPGDVRSVVVELALIEYDRRAQNLLGGRRNVVSIGDGQYTSEGYRRTAEAEALGRLSPRHKHVTI